MNTRILFGMLMASSDATFKLNAVPCKLAVPVTTLVPACRTSPPRPGSMVNLMVVGTRPLVTSATRAVPLLGTLTVIFPLPRLLMRTIADATPGLH